MGADRYIIPFLFTVQRNSIPLWTRPHPPTPFPLSRECMRPKLYMSMVESPSFALFFFFLFVERRGRCLILESGQIREQLIACLSLLLF